MQIMKIFLLLRYNDTPIKLTAAQIAAVFPKSAGIIEVKIWQGNERISLLGHTLIERAK